MKKLLAVGVIILFIGLAFAPSINANISKESVDSELVEITTEICGIEGSKPQTIKITKEQADKLVRLFESIEERLNTSETMDEAVEIFDEAVIELDRLGVLPDGMTVEKAQRLVTGLFKNNRMMKAFEEIKGKQKQPLDVDENRLCLIAGKMNTSFNVFIFSLWNNILYQIFMLLFWISFFGVRWGIAALCFLIVATGFMIDILNPICVGRLIVFLSWCSGTVVTFGLNGLKVWKGDMMGAMSYWWIWDECVGVIGFTGLKILIPIQEGEDAISLFLGFAPWVKIKSVD